MCSEVKLKTMLASNPLLPPMRDSLMDFYGSK